MSSWGGTSVRGRVSMMGGPLYTTIDRWRRNGGGGEGGGQGGGREGRSWCTD